MSYEKQLPKKGDTVYTTDGTRIYESTIRGIIYDVTEFAFDETAIGDNVFLSYEDAEKALNEASKRREAQK